MFFVSDKTSSYGKGGMSAANRIQIASRWHVRHSSGWTGAHLLESAICRSRDFGWLVVWNICIHLLFFHIYWECHHPNWRTHIFQRDRSTTNQLESCRFHGQNKVVLPPQLHRKMVLAAGLNSHWLHQWPKARCPGTKWTFLTAAQIRRGHFYTAKPRCWLLPFAATQL